MISFAELTKQVNLINDLILSDMICEEDDAAEETVIFSKHLLATKYWFARISYANKKRFLFTLLHDVRSAWTLSLLLKSLWNCRLKDSVMSVSERHCWLSNYDQVPMDNNRTALPVSILAQVMKNDRIWFLSLKPEPQALVLSELLTVAGGPAMWAVLHRAKALYELYCDQIMKNLLECIVVQDISAKSAQFTSDKTGKSSSSETDNLRVTAPVTARQRELEANLQIWNVTIKAMRDAFKLEELEMTFHDGTKNKIWKVNRPRPDIVETLDFLQLLPSTVGKLILSYLPKSQLGEYAKVNRYWAYLIEEYRAEMAARTKLNTDFDRLNDILVKHDESLEEFIVNYDQPVTIVSEPGAPGLLPVRSGAPSCRASEKSAGAYSLRFLSDRLAKPITDPKPIRNMADLHDRLEKRGAADENIWKWCENTLVHAEKVDKRSKKKPTESLVHHKDEEGVLVLGTNVHFPCPMMKKSLEVPLKCPLYKDPARIKFTKTKRHLLESELGRMPGRMNANDVKHFSLWTRDLSSLYPVFKIPSYNFPPS